MGNIICCISMCGNIVCFVQVGMYNYLIDCAIVGAYDESVRIHV